MVGEQAVSDAQGLLIQWFEEEFLGRTLAVHAGSGSIDWVNVTSRVSWTEVVAASERLDLRMHPLDFRLWWAEQRDWDRWTRALDARIAEGVEQDG